MDLHTWRNPDPTAVRWLAPHASTGYGLSEIEDRVAAMFGRDDPEPDVSGGDETAGDTATQSGTGA